MEKFCDIIGNLGLAIVLDLELLLVELAEAVNAATDVFEIQERARVVVMSELDQKDCVSLVGL